jgi:hypothetical protein
MPEALMALPCPRVRRSAAAWLLALSLLPSAVRCQQAPAGGPAAQYAQLAQGILMSGTPIFATDSIPHYRVEVRDLIVGPKQSAPEVPLKGFALMELRSGIVETTIDGKAERREAGSYWLVPPRSRLAIRNIGEVAIVRVVLLTPR